MCWLWLQHTEPTRPWAQLPFKEDRATTTFFQSSTITVLGDGAKFRFWVNAWLDGQRLDQLAPNLVAAVPSRCQTRRTLASALENNNWMQDITTPRTVPVLVQYVLIRERIEQVALRQGVEDKLLWHWSASGRYLASSACNVMFLGQTQVLGAKELWEVKAPNKCRFFVWLALHKCHWMSERLWRQALRDDALCAFCNQKEETIGHLLVGCSYAREVWFKILSRCGWQDTMPENGASFITWWLHNRKRVPKHRRAAFDLLIILTAWSLWVEHNARAFDNASATAVSLVKKIWVACDLWCKANLIVRSLLDPG
jgi:hypothetical protein